MRGLFAFVCALTTLWTIPGSQDITVVHFRQIWDGDRVIPNGSVVIKGNVPKFSPKNCPL